MPQNKYAWAIRLSRIALRKDRTTWSWPTTSSKRCGRYLRATTVYAAAVRGSCWVASCAESPVLLRGLRRLGDGFDRLGDARFASGTGWLASGAVVADSCHGRVAPASLRTAFGTGIGSSELFVGLRRAKLARSVVPKRDESDRNPPGRCAFASARALGAAFGIRMTCQNCSRARPARRGRGEPGRFSQAHEGVVYGCCVPALTRFTSPHCPGPPRLTPTPAITTRAGRIPIVKHRTNRCQGQDGKWYTRRLSTRADGREQTGQ